MTPVDSATESTYELTLRFCADSLEARKRQKGAVMAWLSRIGRTDFIEGFVDGIHDPLGFSASHGESEIEALLTVSPILLYDRNLEILDEVSSKLTKKFGSDLKTDIIKLDDSSWKHAWESERKIWSSEKFIVVPKGLEGQLKSPDGKIPLYIDASDGAFGDAQHRTTQGLLKTIEKKIPSEWKPASVLDVGTGTGILAIACNKLGVFKCVGTEIDQNLVDLAHKNAVMNNAKFECLLMTRPKFGFLFDLVIANILAPVLHDLMEDIFNCMAMGGRLLLAGFVEKEQIQILQKYQSLGMIVESIDSERGWQVVILRKIATP